jgi:hypothetical protein
MYIAIEPSCGLDKAYLPVPAARVELWALLARDLFVRQRFAPLALADALWDYVRVLELPNVVCLAERAMLALRLKRITT